MILCVLDSVLKETTGHKLQGMSKDGMIITKFDYSFPNWVYVVLSRVRTLDGLYLYEKLKYDPESLALPRDLVQYETFLRELEQRTIDEIRNYGNRDGGNNEDEL